MAFAKAILSFGPVLTTLAVALRQMYNHDRGSISVHSLHSALLKAPYVAAKHGLIGRAKRGMQTAYAPT